SFAFILTPSGTGPADVTVQVPAGAAQDASGKGNNAAAPFSITFDNTSPSVILTSANSMGTFQSPIPATVLFSKPVTGFTAAGLAVGNATVANFAGTGARYTFDLIPNGIGQVTATVLAGSARDAAGNQNTASATFSRVFEVAPVATIYSPAGPYTNGSAPI